MAKIPFAKPALSLTDQLNQLKNRGLIIGNEPKALHLLENVSYYRLSGYWYPLLDDKVNHTFKQGADLETAFKLYCFDRELRKVLLSEIEKIEIAIRAKLIYILSHQHDAFWFQNHSLFSNFSTHLNTLSNLNREYSRSDETFVSSFQNKYSDPLPPAWMVMEIVSFGTLSFLYKNLKPSREKKDIANHFGLNETTFESWIHTLIYLRNICAHHNRLWNREMSIKPQLPRMPKKTWLTNKNISNNKSFFAISMILYFLQTVNPHHSFRNKFDQLRTRYPMVDLNAMGFPQGWENEPLWQSRGAAQPAAAI